MIYSPDAGDAAYELTANIDKSPTSKRRFIVIGERTIYAGNEIAQVAPHALSPATADRHHRCRLQPIWVHLTAQKFFPRLPFTNQRKLIPSNQGLRGQWARIVI